MEPCGTPWLPGNGWELYTLMKTSWCLLDQYEWDQERAVLEKRWLRRTVWETVLNTAQRSGRTRMLMQFII